MEKKYHSFELSFLKLSCRIISSEVSLPVQRCSSEIKCKLISGGKFYFLITSINIKVYGRRYIQQVHKRNSINSSKCKELFNLLAVKGFYNSKLDNQCITMNHLMTY